MLSRIWLTHMKMKLNHIFFIDHILIPVIASVFAVENPLPVHQELVNICRIFLRKHRVIVSAHPDIGEYYAVARVPKRQIEQLEKGEKLDESWTLNHNSVGSYVAIKTKEGKLVHGFINRYAPPQNADENQEQLPETDHILWEDGDTGDFYGEQQYNDAAQLFTMNKKKFRRPESKKNPGRVYIEDYEITFKSKSFMKACQLYDNPTDVVASYVERFIILGLIKFLHELFHSFTDFKLDLEWFYTQRMNTNIILRYPRTPPRVGVHIYNTKHKLIMGDMGYALS